MELSRRMPWPLLDQLAVGWPMALEIEINSMLSWFESEPDEIEIIIRKREEHDRAVVPADPPANPLSGEGVLPCRDEARPSPSERSSSPTTRPR